MQRVSRRFKANLRTARWVRRVEYSNDGLTWVGLKASAAKVTPDAKSQVRWSFDGTLADPGRHELHAYGTQLRVAIGMWFGPGDVEWVQLGRYRVESAKRALRSSWVDVKAASFEAAVIGDEFYAVRVIEGGTIRSVAERLIQETLPDATLLWRGSSGETTVGRITTENTDRWAVIDGNQAAGSLARAAGARIYCDASGAFVGADVPSLEDPPVGVVDEGPGGVLLTATEELTRSGVYNSVAVRGESTDGTTAPVGPCVIEDRDPLSPTYVGRSPLAGGFGRVVYHYSSQLITTEAQGYKAARGFLAPLLGLKQQISWQGVFDPTYEPGDVVLVRSPAGLTPTLLDSLSFDLVGLSMDGSCRQTATRLAGDVALLPDSTADGG